MFDEDEAAAREDEASRARQLKEQAGAATPAAGVEGEAPAIEFDYAAAPQPARQPWSRALEANVAPLTSEFEQLTKQGVDLPPPEQLDDAAVSKKVAEIADAMSKRNVFLEQADHLSDRELYEHLYRDTLHEAKKDVPVRRDAFSSTDLVVGAALDEDAEKILRLDADALRPAQQAPSFDVDRLPADRPDAPLIDDETPLDGRWLSDETES